MLNSIFKFLRINILFTCYTIAFIGSAYGGKVNIKTVLILPILGLWYLHAASANDYADRYIDKINLKNAKDRPLINSDISNKQLWVMHYVAGTLVLIASYFYSKPAVILTAIVLLIDYIYSFKPLRVSDRGIHSQLLLPIAYVYFPVSLGYWASQTAHDYPWLLSLGIYLGFVSRLLLKDFRDVIGDKRYGKNTFLLRHGALVTCQVSALFSVAALAILSKVIDFSPGSLIILFVVQYQVILTLIILSKIKEIDLQVLTVKHLARLGNISVLIILIFYLMRIQIIFSSILLFIAPVLIGTMLILLSNIKYNKQKLYYAKANK